MESVSFHTDQLNSWLVRLRDGDLSARMELLHHVHARMERLVRKMLREFPLVKENEQTADVLQMALIRLMQSLPETKPSSVREFFGLAALQIRRELLDLARFYGRQRRKATPPPGFPPRGEPDESMEQFDPPDRRDDPAELERWSAFHEEVEKLPGEEREVVSLLFYHGWSQVEIAELFQVSEKWVRRRWQSACLRLHSALGSRLPDLEEK